MSMNTTVLTSRAMRGRNLSSIEYNCAKYGCYNVGLKCSPVLSTHSSTGGTV